MKKLILSIFASIVCTASFAQPESRLDFDPAFERVLIGQGYDTDNNGRIGRSEAERISRLVAHASKLYSLKGIEHLTNLTWLDCGYNNLTSMDVSNNTALTSLDCSDNNLTSLDFSSNTALTELSCLRNNLTSLDVSKNTALTELSCLRNNLTSMDVSNNTALTELYCDDNDIDGYDLAILFGIETSLTVKVNKDQAGKFSNYIGRDWAEEVVD